jgi:protein-S-isoprenylcysteine O-methyltransferase Ste14
MLDSLGFSLILFGEIFRISARGYKSENSQGGAKLVTGGPYILVRNPMYLGSFLIGLGFVLMIFQWWVILIFVLFFCVRFRYQILLEENSLRQRFKEEYLDYCKRTPSIIPKFNKLVGLDIRNTFAIKWKWFRKEIFVILGWLLLAFAIEAWEDIGSFGSAEYIEELLFCIIIGGYFLIIILILNVKDKS